MTDLWTQAQRSLATNDPRLDRLDALRQKADSGDFSDDDKDEVLFCLRGAYEELRRSEARLDTFRDVVLLAAGTLLALVGVVGIVGLLDPGTFPVCFSPEAGGAVSIVCPSHSSEAFSVETTTNIEDVVRATVASTDVFFVMFLGLVGAALSAANSVRGLRATAGPYSISVALAALKLSTGALIALIGIMLINAGLVPGLKGFESSAEIIAWALIFGYSQQLFTGVVDRQAQSVIEQSSAPRTSAT